MSQIQNLLAFINQSPTAFHAVHNIRQAFDNAGFRHLHEDDMWSLRPGEKYYLTRGGTSVIGFVLPQDPAGKGFHIVATHSDSPSFKLKENPDLRFENNIRVNIEKYGSMLLSSWFDRPLSIAGRIYYEENNVLECRLVDLRNITCLIPSVAVHLRSDTAEKPAPRQLHIDLVPLAGQGKGSLRAKIAKATGIPAEAVLSHDLYLYNTEEGFLWGSENEFYSAPRIDNLSCSYAAMEAFIHSEPQSKIPVFAAFDNEEIGSVGRQGALSDFMASVLERICLSQGKSREEYLCHLPASFLLSADNAHAVHPNHPELSDAENKVCVNGGIVIKRNASLRYTTDAFSSSYIQKLCRDLNLPLQHYANRSDMLGGSTLGTLLQTDVSIPAADIGLAQWAMHSSLETAGSFDIDPMIRFLTHFYKSDLKNHRDSSRKSL